MEMLHFQPLQGDFEASRACNPARTVTREQTSPLGHPLLLLEIRLLSDGEEPGNIWRGNKDQPKLHSA